MNNEPLKLRFVGALVEQLGAQLYPSATATVAELISNAWDADARNVWVEIPLGETWSEESEITVLDDGHGMTRSEAQDRYLRVGRKRRAEGHATTPGGRLVHGRKGIGKLAAFGTARKLECWTVRDGQSLSFELDYDEIVESDIGTDYVVEEQPRLDKLTDPEGNPLDQGTQIRLTHLRIKRATPKDQFMTSMSRRFALDKAQMKVIINGDDLELFDLDFEFRFPKDGTPNGVQTASDNAGWCIETLPDGNELKWWIGFTPKPVAEALRGISVLSRGKMVQRPFLFGRSGGVRGQLGQQYIVGEVIADWIDTKEDLIQTNRDQLQLEEETLQGLLRWGRKRLDWALSQWADRRRDKAVETLETPEIQDLIQRFTETEQANLIQIAKRVAQFEGADASTVRDFMGELVNCVDDKAVKELMDRVREEDDVFQTKFWGLVREFSLIDARRTLSLVRARLHTIERLENAVVTGAREVPDIHGIIKDFPWLIDPRWSLLGDEVDLRDIRKKWETEVDAKTGQRLDFLFAMQPKAPAPVDEILVVEIKRSRRSDGTVYRANEDHVNRFHGYVLTIDNHYRQETRPPRVTGLMIADGYTEQANMVRTSLESADRVSLMFSTWKSIIDNTKRLHTGWLQVSESALAEPGGGR